MEPPPLYSKHEDDEILGLHEILSSAPRLAPIEQKEHPFEPNRNRFLCHSFVRRSVALQVVHVLGLLVLYSINISHMLSERIAEDTLFSCLMMMVTNVILYGCLVNLSGKCWLTNKVWLVVTPFEFVSVFIVEFLIYERAGIALLIACFLAVLGLIPIYEIKRSYHCSMTCGFHLRPSRPTHRS